MREKLETLSVSVLKEFAKDKNIVNLVKNNQLTKEDINNNFSFNFWV